MAAKSLRVSQPSLSAQLKLLEHQIGVKLFKKVGRRLKLTEAGEHVFGYCRRMFETAEELQDYLQKPGKNSPTLKAIIGVSEGIEKPFAVEVISSLMSQDLKLKPKITMISGQHAFLLSQLRSHAIDVLLTNTRAMESDVISCAHLKMPIVIAYSTRIPGILSAQLDDLKKLKENIDKFGLALPSPKFKLRYEVDNFLQSKKITGRVTFESDMLAALVRAIADGLGIGFIPLPYILQEIQQKRVKTITLSPALWDHPVWLLTRKGHEKTHWIGPLQTALKNFAVK